MTDIKKILDDAIIVVNGYAFNKCEKGYNIFNSRTKHVAILTENGDIVETSMDGIEMQIAKDYFNRNKKYLEED